MAQAKDFYSKSVAEAIRQACAEFATSQEKLEIEVLETGSAGIFGLCRKRAHIRVRRKKAAGEQVHDTIPETVERSQAEEEKPVRQRGRRAASGEPGRGKAKKERKRPARQETGTETSAAEQPAEEPRRAAPRREEPRREEPQEPPSEEMLATIRADLARMLQLMGFESEVTIRFADGTVQCHISGAHEEYIVGPEGRTLDSLQYLLRKMISPGQPDKMNIDLDAGNFRERRIEELRRKAVELAEQVKEDGKTQSIAALNPSERRVVHVALQDDKGVRSRSVGDGLFKKVLIYKPGKSRKSGSRRRGRQGGGAEE